ncbi:MAG TPA: hypothetical protein VF194_10010 [Ferrovibrio sp.]|jgi:hypothetical protein|uniref:hypothetical protein n=1 Tax=Ferrovibrio sp. TaxID=1917215 RepID=UPI002ED225F8
MFQKSDGSWVWLKAAGRLPYLALRGVIDDPQSYAVIRRRLYAAYEPLFDLASGDAFWLGDLPEGGTLLFCADASKACALLLLGRYVDRDAARHGGIVQSYCRLVDSRLARLCQAAAISVRLEAIQAESALAGH